MKRVVLTVVLMLMLTTSMAQRSQSAYQFLRIPVSSHAAALGGDNLTITDDDATLLFNNPALTLFTSDKTLNLNYLSYIEGSRSASASFVGMTGERASWGVSGQLMDYGELRQTNVYGEQTGTFSAKDISVGATLAYQLTDNLSGGVTAKAITSHIGQFSSVAAGIDLGLHYYISESEWSFAAVARNLGGQLDAYDDEFEPMPLDIQIGATKRLIGSPLRISMTIVRLNDWEHGIGKHLVVGADLLLGQQFYVAAGYNAMRAAEMKAASADGESAHGAGLSVGCGMSLQRFKLGLAYAKYHVSASSLLVNVSYSL